MSTDGRFRVYGSGPFEQRPVLGPFQQPTVATFAEFVYRYIEYVKALGEAKRGSWGESPRADLLGGEGGNVH